jgi:hypothetical protein
MSRSDRRERPEEVLVSRRRLRHGWTITPVQAVIGRRVGFRYHWAHWIIGLALMYVIGVAKGFKLGRDRRARRARAPG